MRKLIIAVITVIVMAFVANNAAHAEVVLTTQSIENVSIFAHKAIPDVSHEEIEKCYNAVVSGGEYEIKRKKIKITCAEEEMVVFRRFF